MGTFRIIGLDPGGTTGWATYTADRINATSKVITSSTPIYEYYDEQWACGQLDPHDHHYQLYSLLELQATEDSVIICEAFDYRNQAKPGLELISREYIGVVKLFSQERKVPYILQTASQGKVTKRSFVRKENLEKLDLWVSGGASKWNHAMDAYGHILYYMIHNNIQKDALLRRGWK